MGERPNKNRYYCKYLQTRFYSVQCLRIGKMCRTNPWGRKTNSDLCNVKNILGRGKNQQHKDQNSYIESDLVKLAKQMKSTLNLLINDGVKEPKVCGIHCEGENICTFIMDLPSPKLYRLCNVSKIKLFESIDQLSLLPGVLSHLLFLESIASETAAKIEDAVLYKYNHLKRPSPVPPKDWLSRFSDAKWGVFLATSTN